MAAILSHPRVYSFLHIPVQSGSDKVLADMRREYSSGDFRQLVDFLKEKCDSLANFCLVVVYSVVNSAVRVPGINIATDIICGFPTESQEVGLNF